MVDLQELLDSIHLIKLDLNTPFRGVTSREIALIEGPYGWGEFSPFLEYGAKESSRWLASGIEAAFEEPFPRLLEKVRVNATMPAINDPDQIATLMALYPGVKTVKVKVTEDESADFSRIERVQEAAPGIRIRIDVNGSWSLNQAEERLRSLLKRLDDELEYVEQPCNSLEELRVLKGNCDVPIALDEILRKADEPLALDLRDACDLLVLKVSPLGGIGKCMQIADHFGLPVVVSSALESAVGIARGLRLQSALGNQVFDAGLATGSLFKSDIAYLKIADGEIDVSDVIPRALDEFELEEQRTEWWQNRVRESYQVLA
ncbi:MAG: O-succinylbenzoate synthase [Actinobacteria bacterium]|nr:O-succinylbenzoate synthase [Actinomycetota bacterium]